MSDFMSEFIDDPEVRELVTSVFALKNPGIKSSSMILNFSFQQKQIPKLKSLLPDWIKVHIENDAEFLCKGERDGWIVLLYLRGPAQMPCWEAELEIRKQ